RYGSSRMVFSLAERGEAPRSLLKVSGSGVPRRAVFASVAFGFFSVVLNLLWPDTIFLYMLNAVGAVLIFVWALIAISQLKLRKKIERDMPERLTLPMWLFPYATWAALIGMAMVLVLMLFDDSARPQLLWSSGAAAAVLLVAWIREIRASREIRAGRESRETRAERP
ncbi:amino acid transporter, partial [Streptomyces sp. NPDC059956]